MTNSVSSGLVVQRLRKTTRTMKWAGGQHQHAGGDQCRRCGRCRFSRCEERVPEWCVAGCQNHRLTARASVSARSVGRVDKPRAMRRRPRLSRVGRRYSCHACGLGKRRGAKGRRCRGAGQQFPRKAATNPSNSALASQAVQSVCVRKCWPRICCTQPRKNPAPMPPTKARDALRGMGSQEDRQRAKPHGQPHWRGRPGNNVRHSSLRAPSRGDETGLVAAIAVDSQGSACWNSVSVPDQIRPRSGMPVKARAIGR